MQTSRKLFQAVVGIGICTIHTVFSIDIPGDQFKGLQVFSTFVVGWLYINQNKQDEAVLAKLDDLKVVSKKNMPVIQTSKITYIHPSSIQYGLPNGLYFYQSQDINPQLSNTYKTPTWNSSFVKDSQGAVYMFSKNNSFNILGTMTPYAQPSATQYPSAYIQQLLTTVPSEFDEQYPSSVQEISIQKGNFDTSVANSISDQAVDPIGKESFADLASQLPQAPLVIALVTTQPQSKVTYHFVQAKDLDEQYFSKNKPYDKNPINGEKPTATPTYYVQSHSDKKYVYLTDAHVRNRTTPLDMFFKAFLDMVLVKSTTKALKLVPSVVWNLKIDLAALEPLYLKITTAQEKKRADDLLKLLFENYLYLDVEAWLNPQLKNFKSMAEPVIKKNKVPFFTMLINNTKISDDVITAELTDKKLKLTVKEKGELGNILKQKRPALKNIFTKKKTTTTTPEDEPKTEEPTTEPSVTSDNPDQLSVALQQLTTSLQNLKTALAS